MGKLIYDLYVKAGEIGGVKARTKLSMLTKISSVQANSMTDSPENLKIFESAMKEIYKEFGEFKMTSADIDIKRTTVKNNDLDATEKLRKHIAVFADLTAQRSLYAGDLQSTYRRVTEAIVDAIDVERASIWLYDDSKSGIVSKDLFVRNTGEHSSGVFLGKKDFPSYFNAVETERTLAANDAHLDSRTKEFSEPYLKPLGINSLLDVPIWVNGEMVGVVCHEHVGPKRHWTTDEENFAYLMGNIVAMALETNLELV